MFISPLYKTVVMALRSVRARYVNAFVLVALLLTSVTSGVARASAKQSQGDTSIGQSTAKEAIELIDLSGCNLYPIN